ncbi:hypothetical protein EKO04_009706 [Ascochyta lentis]|uniref:Uncharacterized protein n=1 Tax=Ascochyta lentis TaxID=205686 RepID=A0A8H7MF28_9PLEO|nr:hypothetical protein EKO04_009706 [Ascochyta lentis]
MSELPKKRTAPYSGTPSDPKRTKASASATPDRQKDENAFEISVEMDDKFSAYPKRLRQIMEGQYQSLVEQTMTKFEAGSPLQPRFAFAVTRKRMSEPKDPASDYEDTRQRTYQALSIANKKALEEFLVKVSSKRPKFIESKMPQQPMSNPHFARVQSVRAGEVGWGFDMYKCLSLHLTTMDGYSLRHESIYVERKPMEAPEGKEDDDDCLVVENPDAAPA